MNSFEKVLFIVFISIFAMTAVVTLLGITNALTIEPAYLNKLFDILIVEVILAVTGLFTFRFLKRKRDNIIKFRFDVGETYDIHAVNTFKCAAKLIDSKDGKETLLNCTLYHDEFGLCSDIEISNYKQTLSIILDIEGKKFQGSEWLETRTIDLKGIK